MRHRHLLLAAASPLCLAAGAAWAETTISTSVSTPISTATAASGARDDVKVASGGSVKPAAAGSALTLNSDNNVTVEGALTFQDVNDATGLLIEGGRTGAVKISGSITLDETTEAKDTDSDGDTDGSFAVGANRTGVRVAGASPFRGSIDRTGGAIAIEGADSAGILVEAGLTGALRSAGSIAVSGDRGYGIHTVGAIGGPLEITGSVSVLGKDSVAVAVDGDVGQALWITSTIGATGFRYTTRPADTAVAKLDADDLLIGGPAVRISGNVGAGVIIDGPPQDRDSNDADEDDDGQPDAGEPTASITSFGSGAGLLVGAANRSVRLSQVGAGDAGAYGLMIKGVVQGVGVYDGVTATGVQIGGLGDVATVDGGIMVSGTIGASSAKADATALKLGAGAQTPRLTNSGNIKAAASATEAVNVRAVQLDAGSSLSRLDNTGAITAQVTGTKGLAAAVVDASGALRTITNTNQIGAGFTPADSAAAVTGQAIALDLRANTAGVLVQQNANASTSITPSLIGDVLFGSGAARLELNAGTMVGAASFGAGADTLSITGGAKLTGAVTDAGGGLAVSIAKGRLTATNTGTVNLTSLSLGGEGELVLTADPAASGNTFYQAGSVTLADTAKIGLRLTSKLTSPTTFNLIETTSLTVRTLDQTLLGTLPWLYKGELKVVSNPNVDAARQTIVAEVRRRTAAEAGLDAAESAALDAVFANFDRDAAVRDALLAKTDRTSFTGLYDQFLPDHAGGLFQVLAAANEAANRGIDEDGRVLDNNGLRLWTQEIAFIVQRDLPGTSGYDASGFGLAAGIENPNTALGVLGLQTSFVSADVDQNAASASESLTATLLSAGVYWRGEAGGLTAALGVNGGYASMEGKRTVVDTTVGLSKTAEGEWNGMTISGHASLSYKLQAGPFHAKPQLTADYLRFTEDGYTESGGGASVDLQLEDRESQQFGAFAGVAFGLTWGEESAFVWSPELTLGWRQVSGDGAGATTARFVAGGPAFTLAAPELEGGGGVVRAALRGQSEYFDFAVEAGGEMRDDYEVYDARVVARLRF